MLDEVSLYNKITTLQAEMMKFHKEISPVKKQGIQTSLESQTGESKFVSTCIYIMFGFLKILVCLVGPTVFPAIIYCIEGTSNLFWQVTTVSSIITLLLATMMATLLCMKVKIVQTKLKEMFQSLNIFFSKWGPFCVFRDALTSDFLKMNIHKVIYPLGLLFISIAMSYIAYVMGHWILFCILLVQIGFITGILTTIIRDILRSPELLPYHSPCKIKMEYASPSLCVKKESTFERYKEQELPVTFKLLTPNASLRKENPDFTRPSTATPVLQNNSLYMDNKEIGKTKRYQLPFDFGKFLRGLQS